jgi:hypothetical protein
MDTITPNESIEPKIKRPTSVTIIAWYIIIISALFFVRNLPELTDSENFHQYILNAFILCGTLISLGCGIYMLKGRLWSRKIFMYWQFMFWGVFIIMRINRYSDMSPNRLNFNPIELSYWVICLIFNLLILYFLYRPNANQYFEKNF